MTTREDGAKRAEFFQVLSSGGITDIDRALANEALNRAMIGFMARKGEHDNGPYLRDDLERVCGKNSSVMLLIVEAEFAIAAARVLERERCARIAEKFGNPDELLGRNVEATCKAIAMQIREPS